MEPEKTINLDGYTCPALNRPCRMADSIKTACVLKGDYKLENCRGATRARRARMEREATDGR